MSHKFNGGRRATICDTCSVMVTEGSKQLREFVAREELHYCATGCVPPEGVDTLVFRAAAEIVRDITDDLELTDATGLSDAWEGLGDDGRAQIVAAWRLIVADGIEAVRDGLAQP